MRRNSLTGNPVDRLGNRRKDADALAAMRGDGAARLLPMRAGHQLLMPNDDGSGFRVAMPRVDEAPALAALLDASPWVLLGLHDGAPLIALDLGSDEAAPAADITGAEFANLRSVASRLSGEDAALLAHARALLNWRRAHRFCGVCGQACAPEEGGTVMRCLSCATAHFPRTDPAVIMLVRHGDRALLARNARFGETRVLSALAGFVEPGESLEETVMREVFEEAGLRVRDVVYHSSQPWPFPGSIMLGFQAEAVDERIEIDGNEIVEAAFYTRHEVVHHEAHGFALPPPMSIAHRLIADWCNEEQNP